MTMRLLPKEPVMLRDTTGQDRVIESSNPWSGRRRTVRYLAPAERASNAGVEERAAIAVLKPADSLLRRGTLIAYVECAPGVGVWPSDSKALRGFEKTTSHCLDSYDG